MNLVWLGWMKFILVRCDLVIGLVMIFVVMLLIVRCVVLVSEVSVSVVFLWVGWLGC